MPPAPGSEIRTAGCKSSHENSEHGGNGIGRMSKDQPQGLGPCDLVDEAGRSGEEKTDQDTYALGRRCGLFFLPPSRHRYSKASIIAQRTIRTLDAGRSPKREYVSGGAESEGPRDQEGSRPGNRAPKAQTGGRFPPAKDRPRLSHPLVHCPGGSGSCLR
jgi:hypothetical protein